jgi:hypothetical protein
MKIESCPTCIFIGYKCNKCRYEFINKTNSNSDSNNDYSEFNYDMEIESNNDLSDD